MTETTAQLLQQSIPLARHWASTLCRHVDDSGHSCAPFHEIWQILRCLGLNTTPVEHREFFINAMTPAIRAGARRVLISGTADYAMLQVVQEVFAANGVAPDVTVLDICETPLRLCQWYADKMNLSIRTPNGDVLAWRDETPYDLICTHSFLGLFDQTRRQELVCRWHGLLAHGGRVLSVNRVRPGAPVKVSFTPDQATKFVRQVSQLLAKSQLASSYDAQEIAVLANRYIGHRVVYPVRDEEEISTLFSSSGFRLEYLDTELLASEHSSVPAGPTLRGGARYACFVARRSD